MDTRAPATPVRTPAPALLRAALDASAEAVLLCRRADHTILLVNAAATELLPGVEPGATALDSPLPGLARATAEQTNTLTDEYRGRHLRGCRRPLDDDHYGWYLRDTTEEARRAAADQAERDRTAFLAETARRLSASLHERRCVRTTVELAVSHLADAAVVVLPARRREGEWIRLVDGAAVEEGTLRESVLGDVPGLEEALAGLPPIPSRWLDASQVPTWLLPERFGPVGALLVTPLPGNTEPAGALVLLRRGPEAVFSPDDEMLARIFAARAGGAISAAALYRAQADTAAILRADLVPPELPQPDGVELIGSHQPAKREPRIGGEFYDVYGPTEQSPQTVVALGDVCGKGPEAALLTGKVRHTLRALRLVDATPAAMLTVLNRALLGTSRRHRFVTLVIAAISRAEHGRVRLDLATGGHPAPLVLRADGSVEAVPVSGTLIGVLTRIVVQAETIELAPGELCLMYSDGLIEARGGATGNEPYGEARLCDALAGCRGMPGRAAVERVRQLVCDWVHGGAHDDITMLVVRAPARAKLSLMDTGGAGTSPFAIDARRGDRRGRTRP